MGGGAAGAAAARTAHAASISVVEEEETVRANPVVSMVDTPGDIPGKAGAGTADLPSLRAPEVVNENETVVFMN
jgi:thioredoxin reductase